MKNLLSENMLRFGTKNLSETAQRELVLKSIMETINEHGLHKDVTRRLNEALLMEGTDNTTLVLSKAPADVNRSVCGETDYFKVECKIKNTGTEIAYLSRGAFGGKGLRSDGNFKTTIDGVSKFSDHDNSGVIMPIVPVGKEVILTMVVNTDLRNWNSKVTSAYNKVVAERNPTLKPALQQAYKDALAEPKFGQNYIYIEYNGGKLNIPVTTNIVIDPKNSCDAPIDIAKGF